MNVDISALTVDAIPWLIGIAGNIALALLIAVAGWIGSKWARSLTMRLMKAKDLDRSAAGFVAGLVQYSVLGAAIIASLGAVGVGTTSLVAVFASAGLAIGLALQGSLSNFASGVMILVFRPFEVGDVATAAGQTGIVTEVGLLATTLQTPDNLTVIIPNAAVTGGTITNITRRGTRRGAVEVGVAYGTDVEHMRSLLDDAARRTRYVKQDLGVTVAFTGLGASSIDFTVLAWADCDDYLGMLDELRKNIYEALNADGVDIPYPQMVLHWGHEAGSANAE